MGQQMSVVELELPALVGSEKQVAWAAGVREEKLARALRAIDQQVALARQEGLSDAEIAEAVAGARAIIQDVLIRRTHAGWWIDQRASGALRTFALD